MKLKKVLAAVTSTVIAAGMLAAVPVSISADEAEILQAQANIPAEPIELLSEPVNFEGTFVPRTEGTAGDIGGEIPGYDWEKTEPVYYNTSDYSKLIMNYTVNDRGNASALVCALMCEDGAPGEGIGWKSAAAYYLSIGTNLTAVLDLDQYPGKYFSIVDYHLWSSDGEAGNEFTGDITLNSLTLVPAAEQPTVDFENAELVVQKYPMKVEGIYNELAFDPTFDGFNYGSTVRYANDYESLIIDYTVNDVGNAGNLAVYVAAGMPASFNNEGPLGWKAEATWDKGGLKVGEHQRLELDFKNYADTYFSAIGYWVGSLDDISDSGVKNTYDGQPCTADITINGVWLTKRQTTEQQVRTLAWDVPVKGDFGEIKEDETGYRYSNLDAYFEGYGNNDYRNIDVGKYSYMEVDYTVNDPGNAYQLGVQLATADFSNRILAGSWQNGMELTAGEHQKFYLDFSDQGGNTYNYIFYYIVSKENVSDTPFTGDITINSVKFYPKGAIMPQKEAATVKVINSEVTVHSLDIYEQIYEAAENIEAHLYDSKGEEITCPQWSISIGNEIAAAEDRPGRLYVYFVLDKETAAQYELTGNNEFYITTHYSDRKPGTYRGISYTDSIFLTVNRDIEADKLNENIAEQIKNAQLTLNGFDGSADYEYGAIGSVLASVSPVTPGEDTYTVEAVIDADRLFIEGDTYIPEGADITLGYSEGKYPESATLNFNVNVTYKDTAPVIPDTPNVPDIPNVPDTPGVPSVPDIPTVPSTGANNRVGDGGSVPTDINTGAAVMGVKALKAAERAKPGDRVDVIMTDHDNAAEILEKIKYKNDVTVNLKYSGYTVSVNSDDLSGEFEAKSFYSSARFLTAKEKSSFSDVKELRQIRIQKLDGIEKATLTVTMRGGSKGLDAAALNRTGKGKFREIASGKVADDMTFSFEITAPGNYVVYAGDPQK